MHVLEASKKDRIARMHQLGRRPPNGLFARYVEPLAQAVAKISKRILMPLGQHCAAMGALGHALFFQLVQIAADGFLGHAQRLCQRRHIHPPALQKPGGNGIFSFYVKHVCTFSP